MQAIIGQLPPADIDALNTITYTIGGMVLWPGNQIDRKWTINQARGYTGSLSPRSPTRVPPYPFVLLQPYYW